MKREIGKSLLFHFAKIVFKVWPAINFLLHNVYRQRTWYKKLNLLTCLIKVVSVWIKLALLKIQNKVKVYLI